MNSIDEERSYRESSDQSSGYRIIVPYAGQPPSRKEDFEKWNRMRGEAVGYMRAFLDSIDVSDTIFIVLHVYVMEHLIETGVKLGGDDGLAVMGMYHSSFESCRKIGDLSRVQHAYSQVTRFLALTKKDRDEYAAAGMTNASFIYNPVKLLTEPEERPWEDREKKIVYVGRFSREKNIADIVRVWADLAGEYEDWTLDIYGVGPEENNIATAILENRVTRSVRLMGPTQNPEEVFAKSRIMVMASDYEGLPVAVVEAGLCGLPTVTVASSPGMSVLVEDGVSGFVTPKGDLDAFSNRLRQLLEDDSLNESMGAKAKDRMSRFEPERIINDWERLFEFSGI
ncbi:glycosyltransferase [Brevibacterium aurantiacum]|nr:glycosyltransferase [Brevibacterium aurantiacum]